MKSFKFGRFHTGSLIKLAQINALISYECHTIFGVRPTHLHPTTVRAYFGLRNRMGSKLQVGSDLIPPKKLSVKHAVLDFAISREPHFPVTLTRSGFPSDLTYDASDAYVVALYELCARLESTLFENPHLFSKYLEAHPELHKKFFKTDGELKPAARTYFQAYVRDLVKCQIFRSA